MSATRTLACALLLVALTLALGCGTAAPSSAMGPVSPASPAAGPRHEAALRATTETAPEPLWSFHAGAPLSGPPGFADDGSLAVGTQDGYVHALYADGGFRFSYTVPKRVLFSPIALGDGAVIAAGDPGSLLALGADGALLWDMDVGGGIASPLELDAKERIWLRTGMGTALAISRRGSVVGFAKVGRAMTLGPAPLDTGEVVVASPAGTLGMIDDFGAFRTRVGPAGQSALAAAPGGFLTVHTSGLAVFGPKLDELWRRADIDRVLCARPLVAFGQGYVRWLKPDGGDESSVEFAVTPSDAALCVGESVLVADGAGALVELGKAGALRRIAVSRGPVLALGALRPGEVLVSHPDGRLASFRMGP